MERLERPQIYVHIYINHIYNNYYNKKLELGKKQQPIIQTSGESKPSTHLPDDLAQKLDEIRKIKSDLEELKNNFSNVKKINSFFYILLFRISVCFLLFDRKQTRGCNWKVCLPA